MDESRPKLLGLLVGKGDLLKAFGIVSSSIGDRLEPLMGFIALNLPSKSVYSLFCTSLGSQRTAMFRA